MSRTATREIYHDRGLVLQVPSGVTTRPGLARHPSLTGGTDGVATGSFEGSPTLSTMTDRAGCSSRDWLAGIALLTGAALGGVLVLGAAVRLLTGSRIVPAGQLPKLPVALVLGAEVYADGVPSAFLRARLDLAADLYRRGLVDRILVSGDGRSRFYDETAGMRDYLVELGIPADVLLLDSAGLDTFASCRRARDVFGVRRLVVVSQRYHLPRALAICRALGMDVWGVGDETARTSARTWAHGTRRELAANLKVIWDLLSHWSARA